MSVLIGKDIGMYGVQPNERVVNCSPVKFKWEEVKCRQVK